MDSRSRSNILLEERINQVDDFNLDALFETQDVVEEVSAPQEEQEISLKLEAIQNPFGWKNGGIFCAYGPKKFKKISFFSCFPLGKLV